MSQTFKYPIPLNILIDILEKICVKTDKYYFIDISAFKKLLFHEYQFAFIELIRPYYHESKHFYLDRDFNYTSFINIVRQICKSNKVEFKYNIKYSDYKYNIQYYIYHS